LGKASDTNKQSPPADTAQRADFRLHLYFTTQNQKENKTLEEFEDSKNQAEGQ